MENLEEKILEILGDPEKMAGVMELAKNLTGMLPDQATMSPSGEDEGPNLGALLGMMQQIREPDDRREALLQALLPYLRPQRQKKLQNAIRLAKLSHLAGFALKAFAESEEGR